MPVNACNFEEAFFIRRYRLSTFCINRDCVTDAIVIEGPGRRLRSFTAISERNMVDLPCVCADRYSIRCICVVCCWSGKVTPSPEKWKRSYLVLNACRHMIYLNLPCPFAVCIGGVFCVVPVRFVPSPDTSCRETLRKRLLILFFNHINLLLQGLECNIYSRYRFFAEWKFSHWQVCFRVVTFSSCVSVIWIRWHASW